MQKLGKQSCDTSHEWKKQCIYFLSLQSEIKLKGKKAIKWHRNHKEKVLKNKIAVIVLNINMNI